MSLNETHDVALRSWVQSATDSDADFPIQNLPPAAFRPRGQGAFRIVAAGLVGIGLGSATGRVLPADVRG